jgi:uncharacterized protein (TIGR02266 family)
MRVPIIKTEKYKNCQIEINTDGETLVLYDPQENHLGTRTFEEILDYLTGPASINKRKDPRTALSVRIRYTGDQGRWYESITDTIGGGGLFIETRTPLSQGTPIKVELSLPDKKHGPIQAEGFVAWTRTKFERILYFPGMGIQFTKVAPEDRKVLLSEINLLNRLRGVKEEPPENE